jgi:predicted transcriptional regulator of viral defense system
MIGSDDYEIHRDIYEKRVFDFSFVVGITNSENLARETLQNYLKKGYIKRVKRNLYVTKSLEKRLALYLASMK